MLGGWGACCVEYACRPAVCNAVGLLLSAVCSMLLQLERASERGFRKELAGAKLVTGA
jgi:hypothetical protein